MTLFLSNKKIVAYCRLNNNPICLKNINFDNKNYFPGNNFG